MLANNGTVPWHADYYVTWQRILALSRPNSLILR